jgi:hypothetical protein
MEKTKPISKTTNDILTDASDVIETLESRYDRMGLTGQARNAVRMMGQRIKPEHLRANGAKLQPDGSWLFWDGSVLPASCVRQA